MAFGRERGMGGVRGLAVGRPAGYRGLGAPRPAIRFGAAAPRQAGWLSRALARDSRLRHVDWVLLAAVLALSAIGTLLVWSATAPGLSQAGANPHTYLEKQSVNVVIGLVLMAAVTLIDYPLLRIWAPFAYGAGVLGLLAVLSPLGSTINGSHSWIVLPGGYEIEPSEYAKLGMILMLALIFAEARDRAARPPGWRQLALAAAVAVPVTGMVVAEPDLGVVVVMVVIAAAVIAMSGLRLRWLAALAAAGALGVFAVFKLHLLQSYQTGRLTSFLHPGADQAGTGWQALQAKIAVGSGGMFGQGLFHGKLIAGSFLGSYSFQGTDFIFAVAGEELGFAGCAAIVALLGLLIFRALRIATRADDLFGLLVAAGIAAWFAIQAFINIGMTIGIAPVTGIPLPFVSYGGSALFADMVAVGLLQSLHRRHRLFS
jgi:rod shape determining protein RodA